jgi:uncharacterized protein
MTAADGIDRFQREIVYEGKGGQTIQAHAGRFMLVAMESSANGRSPLVALLGLRPHPEGGWYRETWRAPASFTPAGYPGERPSATGIYFLLHPGERSRWHVVRSDELWLWHTGGPVELRLGGSGEEPVAATAVMLGADVAGHQQPQACVPGGVWQSARSVGTEPALVSCVVSPGFDFADFRLSGS